MTNIPQVPACLYDCTSIIHTYKNAKERVKSEKAQNEIFSLFIKLFAGIIGKLVCQGYYANGVTDDIYNEAVQNRCCLGACG